MKKAVIAIGGPTATGKSSLALTLAGRINAEIVNCDATQAYRGLDIGSAKPSPQELGQASHHLIDIYEPSENKNVADFTLLAIKAAESIIARSKIPILCGGSGLYIDSAVYSSYSYGAAPANEALRAELYSVASEQGNEALHNMLCSLNSERAKTVHPNNVKRVVRAIEQSMAENAGDENWNNAQREFRFENTHYFILSMPREMLYRRINKRVDEMVELGLEQEAEALYSQGLDEACNSMQAIGYKEFLAYFRGESSYAEAVELIKRNTRRYAKRQIAWFKRNTQAIWLDMSETSTDQAACLIMRKLEGE
ncbi:MAG: tRNA (adenosine(37)-N6)-dimethylallyltransferase MiaA [Eubacteriaceae bacterium]|nr:tRNA (adenosine(37)-N6)-dimethylallyltransferase MiaA [Eubacteriaceae bacterium]